MNNIFAYGTLQNDEVLKALTGKTFKKVSFKLEGYEVLSVIGEYYPGMIKVPSASAEGVVLLDIDEGSFRKIDAWESNEYSRDTVRVNVDGQEIDLRAYVWKDRAKLGGSWNNENYRSSHMQECINVCIPKDLAQTL